MTGKLLKSLREYRKLTQQQVADILGKTKGNVADLEAGEHCTTRVLEKWAAALNFTINISATPTNGTLSKNIALNVRSEISSGMDNEVSEESNDRANRRKRPVNPPGDMPPE